MSKLLMLPPQKLAQRGENGRLGYPVLIFQKPASVECTQSCHLSLYPSSWEEPELIRAVLLGTVSSRMEWETTDFVIKGYKNSVRDDLR